MTIKTLKQANCCSNCIKGTSRLHGEHYCLKHGEYVSKTNMCDDYK